MYYKQSLNTSKIIGSFKGLLYRTNVSSNHFTCGHLTRNLSVIPKTVNQLNYGLFKSNLRSSVLVDEHKFTLVEQQRFLRVNPPKEKTIINRPKEKTIIRCVLDDSYFIHILHNIPAYKKYMPPFTTLPVSTSYDAKLFLSESEILLNKTNWNDLSSEQICTIFIKQSIKCGSYGGTAIHSNNNWHTPFLNAVISSLKNISDNLLNEVIIALCNWPKTNILTSEFKTVFTSLDDEVLTRQHYWDKTQMLYTAYLWLYRGLSLSARSNNYALFVLGNDIHILNDQEFVLYMLIVNYKSRLPRNIDVQELEKKVLAILNNISIEEVGVIALSLVNNKSRLCDVELWNQIIVKTIKNIKGIDNHVLIPIMQLLIYYNDGIKKQIVNKEILFDELHNEAPSLNLSSLMNISLLATRFHTFNPDLLSYIMNKLKENISDLSLNDLEKFCHVLSFFNFKPDISEHFFEALIKDLGSPHRILDIIDHPVQFGLILSYLMHLEIYPHSLITKALQLSPSKIEHYMAKHDYQRKFMKLVSLDYAMDIEQSDYQGNRLTESLIQSLIRKQRSEYKYIYTKKRTPLTLHNTVMTTFEKSLAELFGGTNYVMTTHVLPYHLDLDVIFCTDHDGTPVPIPPKFLNYPTEALKRPCQSNSQTLLWNIVKFISVYKCSDVRCEYPTAQSVMLCRHMKKLGYNVIEIRGEAWKTFFIDELMIYVVKESSLNDTFLDRI